MSPENHGVPEDDDPFAYLYRGEGADGGAAPDAAPQPGVPRTSYQQATQVGRTQYGQPRPQQGQQQYGAQLPQQTQPFPAASGAGRPQTGQHQSAPPGGGRAGARTAGGGRGSGRGLMIGTVAVAAAVAIGIGVALFNNGPDTSAGAAGSNSPAASASASAGSASASSSASASPSAALPGPADAATMTLAGGAAATNNHTGAKSANGMFVPLTAPGQGITWTVNVPADGSYIFWVRFANAGADSTATVVVNGTPKSSPINLKNYTHQSDWAKAWSRSYVSVDLKQGQNTVGLTITAGQGNVNIDQFALSTSKDQKPWA